MKLLLPPARFTKWVANFEANHGKSELTGNGHLSGLAADGSTFEAKLPFDTGYSGPGELNQFLAASSPPDDWGVLLVRKGGFLIARLFGNELHEHKVSRRHVQGRSKAGGQSQQRFARRRDNQARASYQAAAENAHRILREVPVVVTGGDRQAVALSIQAAQLKGVICSRHLEMARATRAVLDGAIDDAGAIELEIVNADKVKH